MVAPLGFFTPVNFNGSGKTHGQKLLEIADSYFHLGGSVAYVAAVNATKTHYDTTVMSRPLHTVAILARILSYLLILPVIIFLSIKALLRSGYVFSAVNVRDKALVARAVNDLGSANVKVLSNTVNVVFKITDIPGVIFKIGKVGLGSETLEQANQSVIDRARRTMFARALCCDKEYLVVPKLEVFSVQGKDGIYYVIAEEELDVVGGDDEQEALYREHAPRLTPATNQLARFIHQSGFSDVAHRNIPLIRSSLEPYQTPKIALIDVEEMEDFRLGLFGREGRLMRRSGLLGCIFSQEGLDEIERYATSPEELDRIAARRRALGQLN